MFWYVKNNFTVYNFIGDMHMRNKKMSGCLLLTALFSMSVFAANNGVLSFDLSSQDEKDAQDPTFHCDITNDKSPLLSSTKITFTTDDKLNFDNKGKALDSISKSDIESKYFYVTKDNRGEGQVTYKANNDSDVVCAKGHGPDRTEYSEK